MSSSVDPLPSNDPVLVLLVVATAVQVAASGLASWTVCLEAPLTGLSVSTGLLVAQIAVQAEVLLCSAVVGE